MTTPTPYYEEGNTPLDEESGMDAGMGSSYNTSTSLGEFPRSEGILTKTKRALGSTKAKLALCCFVFISVVVLSITTIALLSTSYKCDKSGPFDDIQITKCSDYAVLPQECENNANMTMFVAEQKIFSYWKKMKIRNEKTDSTVGHYLTGFAWFRKLYKLEVDGKVVAQAKGAVISIGHKFTIGKCNGQGDTYLLEQKPFASFTSHIYTLKKNGVEIAKTVKRTFGVCKPDVYLVDNNGELAAAVSRNCWQSIFGDKWLIRNYQPDLIPDYVVGFLAYLNTQFEKDSKH